MGLFLCGGAHVSLASQARLQLEKERSEVENARSVKRDLGRVPTASTKATGDKDGSGAGKEKDGRWIMTQALEEFNNVDEDAIGGARVLSMSYGCDGRVL